MYREKCKCGGNIHTNILDSYPSITEKICNKCSKKWQRRDEIIEIVFDPNKEGFKEV